MAKIPAMLSDVSTEFQLVTPGNHGLKITKYEDIMQEAKGEKHWIATRISSEVVEAGAEGALGQIFTDYIHIRKPEDPPLDPANNIGLKTIKRYFEVTHGKEEVAGWTDDMFDSDLLIGKLWRGQIGIRSYRKKGDPESAPERQANEVKQMDSF